MKPTSDLFDLIKSLNRSEKRYFKVFATAISGKEDAVYLTLFELIDKMNEYDESYLSKRWHELKIDSRLTDVKGYLYNTLIKSLLHYSGYNSATTQINLQLSYVELLYEKGLFQQSLKLVYRYKKKFLQEGNYYAYDMLCDWENRIHMHSYNFPKILEVTIQQQQALVKRQTELDFRKRTLSIYRYIYSSHTITQKSLKELDKEASFFLKLTNLQKLDLRTRYYAYSALGYYYQIMNDKKRCLTYHKRNLDMLFENKNFRTSNERFFSSAFQNYCNALLSLGRTAEIKIGLTHLRKWIEKELTGIKTAIKADSVFTIVNSEVLMYNQHMQGYKLAELERSITDLINNYGRYVRPPELHILQFNFAVALFMEKQYAKALDCIRPITSARAADGISELVIAARVFSLILLYEMHETTLVNNIIPTIQKFLHRKKLRLEFEETLFQFLRCNTPQKQNLIRAKLLQLLQQQQAEHKVSILSNYVSLERWLKEKGSLKQ